MLIELRDLAVNYGPIPALRISHLDIAAGECVLVNGPSGCGKSTLARVLSGLIPRAVRAQISGSVRIAGLEVQQHGVADMAQHVGAVFQNPATQLFHLRVEDEVAFGPRNYRQFDRDRHELTLSEADLLDLRARGPFALSMGQQQRTALAACLALRPRLLILDEPTLGQDWGHLQRLMDFLTMLNKHGTAILLITHDYKLVHRYASRVVLLNEGRLQVDGIINKERNIK